MTNKYPKPRKNPITSYRKRMGCVKMSHEILALLLGIEMCSIRFIEVTNDPGFIKIIHDDENLPQFDLAEGEKCPADLPVEFTKFRMEQLRELGWTIIPPKHSEEE